MVSLYYVMKLKYFIDKILAAYSLQRLCAEEVHSVRGSYYTNPHTYIFPLAYPLYRSPVGSTKIKLNIHAAYDKEF